MIRLSQVGKSYDQGKTWAVRDLSLEVEQGQLVVLLGESGCGKTTTLKMINRLIEPSAGTIAVDGQPVLEGDPVPLRRSIGYVFQNIGLFPHMTVGQNVAIGPGLARWKKADVDRRVDELLEMVNMPPAEYRRRRPRGLSGGQRQRVGLARALAVRPRIMLMDEPFGALDPLTRDVLQDEYRKIHQKLGLTSIMVTHDMTEALLMADRIAVMERGSIVQLGTPHELLTAPANAFVDALMSTPRKQAQRLEALMEEGATS
ncbi:MAG: ATP-binding cassette domain-containing protein [Phycisphaeraceae bacterium]